MIDRSMFDTYKLQVGEDISNGNEDHKHLVESIFIFPRGVVQAQVESDKPCTAAYFFQMCYAMLTS